MDQSFWENIGLIAVGAALAWIGNWLTGRQEARRAEASRREEISQDFENVLIRFLALFERWYQLEEIVVQRTFGPDMGVRVSVGETEHAELSRESELLLVELWVKSSDVATHSLIRSVRGAAFDHQEEFRFRAPLSRGPHRTDADGLHDVELTLDRYAAAVGKLFDHHRLARIPNLRHSLWSDGSRHSASPIDIARHRETPSR